MVLFDSRGNTVIRASLIALALCCIVFREKDSKVSSECKEVWTPNRRKSTCNYARVARKTPSRYATPKNSIRASSRLHWNMLDHFSCSFATDSNDNITKGFGVESGLAVHKIVLYLSQSLLLRTTLLIHTCHLRRNNSTSWSAIPLCSPMSAGRIFRSKCSSNFSLHNLKVLA